MIGIIGGSGLSKMVKGKKRIVKTPYGNASLLIGKIGKSKVAFISRHGKKHEIPPHRVNYKANIYAMKKLRVKGIIATSVCGIIKKYRPGDLILPSDFIALHIKVTFFEDFRKGIGHTDFTNPYDRKLKKALLNASKKEGIKLLDGGIIATMPGPRFESKAEVMAIKNMGAHLINMTTGYETILAGEMGIPYVALTIGSNYACGISRKPLSMGEVFDMAGKKEEEIMRIISTAVGLVK